ncbi:MAG: glycosyltransferase family 2 protein, partial [Acidimicrobiales bacterium]
MGRPLIATVIVNWNTADLLEGVLRNLGEHLPEDASVLVVDNDSADDSVERVDAGFPDVEVIQMGENAGFCRANNAGIEASDSEFVLLINTDARLTDGCLEGMLSYFERDPRCAIVGPRLTYADESFQRWTGGRLPTVASTSSFYFFLDRFSDRVPALSSVYLAHDTDEPFPCGWVSSAVMLLRRDALDEFGLMDDRIFLYMDDVDLCQRAHDAGWTTWYAADQTAVHFMNGTSTKVVGTASPEAARSANRWFTRHHGPRAGLAMRASQAGGFGLRAAGHGAIGLATGD